MQRIISNFPISCRNRDTANISTDEVINAVKCLKSKKACGPDKVYNEHLIFGGISLYEQLSSLFSNMYAHGHVPQSLKYGIIITLLYIKAAGSQKLTQTAIGQLLCLQPH